jgi:hypothetical protein
MGMAGGRMSGGLRAKIGTIGLVLLFASLPVGLFLGVPFLYALGAVGALGFPLFMFLRRPPGGTRGSFVRDNRE